CRATRWPRSCPGGADPVRRQLVSRCPASTVRRYDQRASLSRISRPIRADSRYPISDALFATRTASPDATKRPVSSWQVAARLPALTRWPDLGRNAPDIGSHASEETLGAVPHLAAMS